MRNDIAATANRGFGYSSPSNLKTGDNRRFALTKPSARISFFSLPSPPSLAECIMDIL